MKIIFAKNIGFCSGVKRALAIAEKSLKEDPEPIYFLGPLVHNEKVNEQLKKKGARFISNLKEAKKGTLVLRAHGEIIDEKDKNKLKNLIIRDATCPLVKRAQACAKILLEKGCQVIIIGDKNHAEVEGIKSYVGKKAIVIENELEAKSLPKMKKIGVVSQTTQDLEEVNKILEILKKKTEEFYWLNTLCPQVTSRQKELNQTLKKCDGVLVIGSRSSANTKRMVEIAKKAKKKVFWINSLEELKNEKIEKISTLGVVSGTSTPPWEIKKIKKWLKEEKQK